MHAGNREICAHCNKAKTQCECLMEPPAEPPLTWRTMNSLQRFLTAVGYVFAAIIAIGSGVSTAAAFVTLNIVTGGLATIILAALIFSAGVAMNWYINKNAVPEVLVEIFGKGRPFEGLMKRPKGISLKQWKWRRWAMGVGVLLALAVGFTNGVLTYSSTFSLVSAFGFLAAISPAFPPIAAVLAVVTLICLTAVMLKNIAKLVRTKNILQSSWDFLKYLYDFTDQDRPHNKGKTLGRRLAERTIALLFTLIALPLAALGLFMTMKAHSVGSKDSLLRLIPNASAKTVELASKIIALGLALLGRIPFTTQNIFLTIAKIFTKNEEPKPLSDTPPALVARSKRSPSSSAWAWYVLKGVALYSLCLVNAVGNGLISVVGGGGILAGIGGSINSFVAGASNIHLTPPSVEEDSPSTGLVSRQLSSRQVSGASSTETVSASRSATDHSPSLSNGSVSQNGFFSSSPEQTSEEVSSRKQGSLRRQNSGCFFPDSESLLQVSKKSPPLSQDSSRLRLTPTTPVEVY